MHGFLEADGFVFLKCSNGRSIDAPRGKDISSNGGQLTLLARPSGKY